MSDNKRKLYDALSKDYDMGTFEQFSIDIDNEEKRKKLYDATSQEYDFGDFDSFSRQLGYEKQAPSAEPVKPVIGKPVEVEIPQAKDTTAQVTPDNSFPMFDDEPNPPLNTEQEPIRGFAGGFKQGIKQMGSGLKALGGEIANLFTGSTRDEAAALEEIERRERLGINVARPDSDFNTSWQQYQEALANNPTLSRKEKRKLRREFLNDMSDKMEAEFLADVEQLGWAGAQNKLQKERDLQSRISDILDETNGDVATAKKLLKKEISEPTAGDKLIDTAIAELGEMKPTEGFGAWAGNLIPQMIPSAAAMAVGVITKNPTIGRVIGGVGMGTMVGTTAGASMAEAREYGASDAQTWGVGLADAFTEYITEKIPFDRYTKRFFAGTKGKMAKELGDALSNSKEAKTELNRLLSEANQKLGGKLFSKDNLTDFATDILAEGVSEFTAEAIQTITPIIYANPEDYPTLGEIVANGWEGMKAGLFMGSVLGGASKTLEHNQHRSRRKAQGHVDVAAVNFGGEDSDGSETEVVEIVGQNDKGEILALRNNEIVPVAPDAIIEQHSFTFEEFERGRIQNEQDEAYDNGYSLEEPQELNDAKNMYEYQRSRLIESGIVDEALIDDDSADLKSWAFYYQNNHDTGAANRILDYLNAKATYDGMIQHVRDDIADRVTASDAAIDSHTHSDGFVRPATLTTDRKVYIVNGIVTMQEDGKAVDRSRSDESIIIRDAETGKLEFASPHDIQVVDNILDPAQEKEVMRQQITQTFAQEAANKIDGVLQFNPGDVYTGLDENGGQHSMTVVANQEGIYDNGDGTVNVSVDNSEPVPMPKELISAWSQQYNLARLEEYEKSKSAQRASAVEQQVPQRVYEFNDMITIRDENGNPVRGQISAPMDEDGRYEIYTETPVNGYKSHYMTREELDASVIEHNGEPVQVYASADNEGNNGEENIPENGNSTTQNIPTGNEAVPAAEQPSAMSRIPVNEQGQQVFESAPAGDTWAAFIEMSEGDKEAAKEIAQGMLTNAQESFAKAEKASKKAAKGTTPFEISQAIKARKAALESAKKNISYWESVVGYEDAQAKAAEEEKRREKRLRMAEARRIQQQKGRYAEEDRQLGDHLDFRDYVMRTLAKGGIRLKWSDSPDGVIKGLAGHLGFKGNQGEQTKRIWMLSNEDGLYPEAAADALLQGYADTFGVTDGYAEDITGINSIDAFSEMLDVILAYGNSHRGMFDAAAERHEEQIQDMDDYAEGLMQHNLEMEAEANGMSVEEWEQCLEIFEAQMQEAYDELTDEEFNSIFVELYSQENYDTGRTGTGVREPVHEGQRPENGYAGSPQMVLGEESDYSGTVIEGSTEQAEPPVFEQSGFSHVPATETSEQFEVIGDLPEAEYGKETEAAAQSNYDGERETDGARVDDGRAQEVSRPHRRGDIRVFEQGLESSRSAYSDGSERDRREAESERLVSIAKANGLYIPITDTEKLGAKISKRTGESVVYTDTEAGIVYKVKDPYAKSAMKAGVEPEDAIYEHIVHNLLFPETAYTFEGISDQFGEVRIILSQKFINTYGHPTKAQVEEALAARGLKPETRYSFGNDLVSVTDVEGDNVLLGEDGTIYFIDPIIRFKKPVKELIELLTIANERRKVEPNPTEAQKEAGNYRKGHLKIDGLDISIENPKGGIRRGTDRNGKEWETVMANDYGYIRGSQTVDGDHIDIFLSDNPVEGKVYVIDQIDTETQQFDEHKVMYGFNSIEEAEAAYLANYTKGWKGLGTITEVSKDDFKKWLDSSHRKTKPFSEYKRVKTIADSLPDADARQNLSKFSEGDVVRDYYNQKLYRIKKHSSNGVSTIAELDAEGNEVNISTMNSHNNPRYGLAEEPGSTTTDNSVPKQSESVPKEDGFSIEPAQYTTKKGRVLDMFLVKFDNNLTKEQQRAAKELAKTGKGWYDKAQGGFMMRSEESARELANTILNNGSAVAEAQPVSLSEMSEATDGSITVTETPAKEDKPKFRYTVRVRPSGYTIIEREDVSGRIPILDGSFMIEAENPRDMRDILVNNGMQDIAEELATEINYHISKWEFRKQADNEGFNGFKIGEEVMYQGAKVKIHDFEEYGDHRPVLDTGLAPVLYTVGNWEDVSKAEAEPVRPQQIDVEGLIGALNQNGEAKLSDHVMPDYHALIVQSFGKPLTANNGKYSLRIKQLDGAKRTVVADVNTASVGGENLTMSYDEIADILNSDNWEEAKPNPSGNKLVTDERYAELRERMRKKLGGQMNMGIDPEILAIGTEMAVYHIEKGARKFAEFAKQMIEDLGDMIRPYLKAFYNGARELPEVEESGLADEMTPYDEVRKFDLSNFDKQTSDPFAIAEQVAKEQQVEVQAGQAARAIKKTRQQPKKTKKSVSSEPETDGGLFAEAFAKEDSAQNDAQRRFAEIVASDMLEAIDSNTKPYRSIVDIRKRASEVGMEVDTEGRSDILLQELVEDGLVRAARTVIGKHGRMSRVSFDLICKLYEMQPTIAARSSNRIKMQQYSTPLPMAWVANRFAMAGKATGRVLEPTAGNGMLVFTVPVEQVHANELDETRLANLREQGFAQVTQHDATLPFDGGQQYDVVIANPPFGKSEAKEYDGKMIGGLDPQITLNALASMKDDGRAAIIIGGNMEYAGNGSIKSMKSFFTYLYDHYNVKGVVDMSGSMYAKQGTTYPTRMILIKGRRSEEERAQTAVYPPVESMALRKAENFDDLYEIIDILLNSTEKTNGTEVLRSQAGRPLPDSDNSSRNSDGVGHQRQSSKDDASGSGAGRRGRAELEGDTPQSGRPVLGEHRQDSPVGKTGRGTDTTGRTGDVGGRPEQRTVGNGSQPVDRVETQRSGLGLKQETRKRELNEEKLPYRPHNSAFRLESVAPAAMVEAMDSVLSQIEEKHGNIDEFIRSELGYSTVVEAHNALAAEQMDSVAMAIYQMKQGQALIIGDQTGVGKGRQMAALIRWAVNQGEKPIFITQKADLFSDIYRDLVDIGSGDLKPFIFNSPSAKENKGEMVDSSGNVVHKGLSDAKMKKVLESGILPDEYDFAVLTYSQVNTGDEISQKEADNAAKKSGRRGAKKSKSAKSGKATPKATFLRGIAENNYLFLDESHTAAGSSNTGMYLQSIIRSAKAVTFASATFAKRPDTMPLYAIRTAMSQAKIEPEKMIEIIEKGGVTLQEIMSRELTNAGQMVRRERDMTGVVTDWKTITDEKTVRRAKENYDRTIAAFNAIIKFQEDYVKPMIAALDQELALYAESVGVKRGTDKLGVENVPFASKTYNYTKQLMLALKVEAIVDEVAAEIEAGRHPVIALESTMESSIKDYSIGEIIDEPTFSASLLKGLDTVMQYTVKDENGKERHERYKPYQLGPAGEKAYYDLQEFIRESTTGIFISPLDAIIEGLRAKGYKVGELTGRDMYVERSENGSVVVRKRTDKDKKRMQREFNNGTLDVLILNKSASTGISLHASEKFSDQRQRSMIIAQPLSDINDYMQMIGRIDRTGQVHRGYYINLGLPVPAENRFLMMLSTKLKSLNANTTTSQDSESNDVDAPDLLNKYGSQVVVEYLRDNPEIYERMGSPLKGSKEGSGKLAASQLDEYTPQEDDARKVTGYVALLPTKEQEDFYEDVIRRYNDLIKYLNDTGTNDLKITVMHLRAVTIDRRVSSEGIDPNGNNPFARNSYVERVEMDVLRKPMKSSDIRKVIDQINRGIDPGEYMQRVLEVIDREDEARLAAEEARHERAKAKAIEDIEKQREKIGRQQKRTEEEKEAAIEKFITETNEKVEARHAEGIARINAASTQLLRRLRMFEVGKAYLVPENLESGIFDFASPAIFCGYKTKDSKITASTTLAVFATLDGRRRVEVKLSQGPALLGIERVTNDNWDVARQTTLDNWDSQIPNETRKVGYIMTGNILQAIADTQDERGGYPGQLISYTDMEGNIHDGILMPDKWNASMLKSSGAPLSSRMQQIRDYVPIESHDGKVQITGSRWIEMYHLSVPKTKKDGAIFYANDKILKLVHGHGFYPSRGQLRADITADNIEAVVKELTRLGVKVKEEVQEDDNRYRDGDEETSHSFTPAEIAAMETPILHSKGTFKNFREAEIWARANLQGKSETNEFTGESIRVSRESIDKMLSEKAHRQSVSIPVHLSALQSVLDFIRTGIPAEIHPDTDGRDFDVMRLYNAFEVDGKLYRVKSTVKKVKQGDKYYTYEVQEMELIEERRADRKGEGENPHNPDNSINSITGAKLLKGVKKTNSNALILLEDSENEIYRTRDMEQAAISLGKSLGVSVHIITDTEELTSDDAKKQKRMRNSKGWLNTTSGEVVVVLPNNHSVADIEATILHEIVGHKGLRAVVGDQNFNGFLDKVFYNASKETRARIVELSKSKGWNTRLATEEYIARLAETGFKERENRTFWNVVRDFFADMISKAKIALGFHINDKDLRYMLWRSYQMQQSKGAMGVAEDVAMKHKLGVGNLVHRDGGPAPTSSGLARSIYEDAVRITDREGKKTRRANLAHRLRESYQDSMLALKKLQEAITSETGKAISHNENAYIAENRMSSQNKGQAGIYMRDFYKPLQNATRELVKQGAAYEDIIKYLIAKHGLERNLAFSKRDAEANGGTWDGSVGRDYSGLTDLTGSKDNFTDLAEDIVTSFEGSYDTANLWNRINAATKETLRKSYESGLMTKETYEKVRDMFANYIPLRGWDAEVAANEYEYLSGGRLMLSPALKTAEGRKSIADDPIATIGYMAESSIIQGNRNVMKQKLLNFVLNNPTSLATVSEQWYVHDAATDTWEARNPIIPEDATADEVADIVKQFEADMETLKSSKQATKVRDGLKLGKHATKYEGQEHCIRVKRGGKEFCIYINGNPRAAQAVNGMTNPDASDSSLYKAAKAVKNFMARMFTSQNPAFIVTNLSRDVIWAGTAVMAKENKDYVAQYTKNIAGALAKAKLPRLLHKFQNGTLDMSNEVERYFEEFIRNGGETGFTELNTVEDYKRDIKRFIKEAERKGITSVPQKTWRGLWRGIEFMNRSAEDTTRFMVYMTSRQMGRSVADSVYDAKEITVNFNKKGSGGFGASVMNFAYIFFNATVQGLANFGKLMYHHPAKTTAALSFFTMAGMLTPLLAVAMQAMFGDDDESYWDLPEWVRRNNLVFFVPGSGNGYLTIPLPHELRPFFGMGELAFSCLAGKEQVDNALAKGVQGFSGLLPLDYTGNAGNVAVNFTPTIAQPFAQLVVNKDYFGKPIYKNNDYNKLDPEWTKAYKGTNALLVNATKWLNEITGGDNVKSGAIDLNPAQIEHLFESYLGGVGKTLNKGAKTLSMLWDEDMREWRNVPVASSFYQEAEERTTRSQLNREYFDYIEEHDEIEHRISGYKKQIRMGAMEYAEILNNFMQSPEFKRYVELKGYVNAVSKMNSSLKYADKTQREEIEERINEIKQALVNKLHDSENSNK